MVLVCLPSDALLQHLPSYLGFFYLGRGVTLHGYSSKVQLLLLTLDKGYLLFIDYAKAFNCVDHSKLWKILKEMGIPDTWPASWETCMQVRKQQLELDMEQQTGSK